MGFLAQAGAFVVALATVAASLGVLSRLRAVRWLWATNVSDPFRCWIQGVVAGTARDEVEKAIAPIKAELTTNGGASVADAVRSTERAVNELGSKVRHVEAGLAECKERLNELTGESDG